MGKRAGIALGLLLGIGIAYEVVTIGPSSLGVTVTHHRRSSAAVADIPVFATLAFDGTAQRTPEQICLQGDAGRCVACGVGLIDGGLCSWQCVRENGQPEGVMTNEFGSNCHPSFLAGVQAMEMPGDGVTATPTWYDDGGLSDWFERDGGMVTLWGFDRANGPGGFNYWLSDTVGYFILRQESGLLYWFNGSATTPIDGNNTLNGINRNGYGLFVARYTAGVDAGAGPGSTFVFDYNSAGNKYEKQDVGGVPGHDFTSPWYFGSRPAYDLDQNGVLGGVTFWEGDKGNDGAAYIWESFYGMPSQRSYANKWASTLSLPTGIDNTARTGQVDVMNGAGFLVAPEGLQGIDGQGTNWWGFDALDAGGHVTTGTGSTTLDVSRGPFAAYKNAAECDRLFDSSAAGFYCVWSMDAGVPYTTWWWNLSGYLKASDGGAVTTAAHFILQTDGKWQSDGGHLALCDFSGIGYDAGRYECSDRMNPDSGTYVVAGICVGNAGSDVGTVEVCQGQFTNSIALEPPVVDNQSRTAGDQAYEPWPTGWPNFDGGTTVAVELVTEVPYDPDTDWTTAADVIYPLDVEQAGTYGATDHTTTVIYGYTTPGLELIANRDTSGAGALFEDFQIPGIGFTRFHSIATRFQVSKRAGGFKCGSLVKQTDCGTQPAGLSSAAAAAWVAGCKASSTIATNTDVDAGCPGPSGWLTVTGRNAGSIVSTNRVKVLRLRVLP